MLLHFYVIVLCLHCTTDCRKYFNETQQLFLGTTHQAYRSRRINSTQLQEGAYAQLQENKHYPYCVHEKSMLKSTGPVAVEEEQEPPLPTEALAESWQLCKLYGDSGEKKPEASIISSRDLSENMLLGPLVNHVIWALGRHTSHGDNSISSPLISFRRITFQSESHTFFALCSSFWVSPKFSALAFLDCNIFSKVRHSLRALFNVQSGLKM